MIIKYGSYAHVDQEATIQIARDRRINEAGQTFAFLERWKISGRLMADSLAELTTMIDGLKNAYAANGKDLKLLQSDGSGVTSHQILQSQTVGGVRVVSGPSFPDGSGAQYTTFRDYEIELEAELFVQGGPDLISFSETISFTGGGPRDVYIELLNGLPQRQRVQQATVFRAVQSGEATGYRNYPFNVVEGPGPIWPQFEDRPAREVTPLSPRTLGSGAVRSRSDYRMSWSYKFHSNFPLSARPSPGPWR